jgi:hypothetical protein
MMRRQIPLFITFLSGILLIVQYYIYPLNFIGKTLAGWFQAITAFAYVLAAISLFAVNGKKIRDKAPDWIYNAVLLISLTGTLYIGLFIDVFGFGYPGYQPIDEGTYFDWMFQYIYNPLSATMFSLTAFFIASASYRAFKARSVESTLLLGSAFLVMIFRVPLGEAIWAATMPANWDITVFIEDIIMGGFNNAGQRAIQIASAIGLISVSLKIILGVERSYLGGD